jgi:hypothetical protein
MKKLRIVLLLFASLATISDSLAQTVDWDAVEKLAPSTRIRVKTQQWHRCAFKNASPDHLYCWSTTEGYTYNPRPAAVMVFQREEISDLLIERYDWSSGYLTLLAAAGGGGGLDSSRDPTTFAGVKIGGGFITLDLQYDRIQAHSGFSTEGSALLPLFRIPRFQKLAIPGPKQDAESNKRFIRVYAEPGIGYRAGGGSFGGYTSAKMLLLLFPDDKAQPYLELQRRFPFNSPMQGDNRVAVGLMLTICEHCGFD